MIAPAVLPDIPGVVKLGIEAMNNSPNTELKISVQKISEMAVELVSSKKHFCWVAKTNGDVVAVVSAYVHPMMFYEDEQASVVQFYSKEPGAGIKLIRSLLSWVEERPEIKATLFTLECGADPRIGKLLSRMGFKQELPAYVKIS